MDKKLCSNRNGRDEMCGSHDIFNRELRSDEQDGCFLSGNEKKKKKKQPLRDCCVRVSYIVIVDCPTLSNQTGYF